MQTVVGRSADGGLAVRGLFIGDDVECFHRAAELSLKVNFEMLDEPIQKAVVYLDPEEFHSTWLGNKAVYRTRMALADGAELIILAPGVKEFGEDKTIDGLIRKYGYRGTPATLEAVEAQCRSGQRSERRRAPDPRLVGRAIQDYLVPRPSQQGRGRGRRLQLWRSATRCSRATIPSKLSLGINTVNGEEIFFISNPGLGLWAHRSRL